MATDPKNAPSDGDASTPKVLWQAAKHDTILRITSDDQVSDVKVNRKCLMNASDFFRVLLDPNTSFKDKGKTVFDIEEVSEGAVGGLLTWLRIAHTASRNVVHMSDGSIADIWFMLSAALQYGFDPKQSHVKRAFPGWYARREKKKSFTYDEHRQLLYPAYIFNDAESFAKTTKYLAYHSEGSQISESMPQEFRKSDQHAMHVGQGIIRGINAAKGSLKHQLQKQLLAPVDQLLNKTSCAHAPARLFFYEKSLANTYAWPLLVRLEHGSAADAIAKLEEFPEVMVEVPAEDCIQCEFDAEDEVAEAVSACKSRFDGLCLDCIANPKFRDLDEDHFEHAARMQRWDETCRIKHGQPTWWFSFVARGEKKLRFTQVKKKKDNTTHQ